MVARRPGWKGEVKGREGTRHARGVWPKACTARHRLCAAWCMAWANQARGCSRAGQGFKLCMYRRFGYGQGFTVPGDPRFPYGEAGQWGIGDSDLWFKENQRLGGVLGQRVSTRSPWCHVGGGVMLAQLADEAMLKVVSDRCATSSVMEHG